MIGGGPSGTRRILHARKTGRRDIYIHGFLFLSSVWFDGRYFMYMEDYDLCRRIGEKFKVVYYPEAEIIHEHGKASYKSRKMMIIHSQSAIKYFNKWGWFFDKERHKKRKNFLK